MIGCLILAAISCDDLIETESPNNQIAREDVFADSQTAYAALSGLYSSIMSRSLIAGTNHGMGALLGSYADDLDCFSTDINGYGDIFRNQALPTNSAVESVWNNAYQQIYMANAIILGAEQSAALADADRNALVGEALLVRSMIYFYLQRIFDAVPYTTSLDYESNRTIGKTGVGQLLGLLEQDLERAISILPDAYRDTERIYPNRKAAQLLLAYIYLQQGLYPQAEAAAGEIIGSEMYAFQTDIQEVFHKDGAHIIWQLKPQNDGDSTAEASFYYFMDSGPSSYALSESLVDAFAPGDARRSNYMTDLVVGSQQWFRPYKYKNLSGSNPNEYSVIYRLEEAYLIMAEALAMQDRYGEAAPFLNATRLRAGLGEIQPESRDAFIDELLAEKRREFFSELGMRFSDLKRLGRLQDLAGSKPGWQPFRSVLPYPQKELLLNPNLNPQHEGY
ncbi:SusD family protein [compost metagenome]